MKKKTKSNILFWTNIVLVVLFSITLGFIICAGFFSSEKIIVNEWTTEDITVQFNADTLYKLNNYFSQITIGQGNEFSVCLIGNTVNNSYFITGTDQLYIGNNNSTNSSLCKDKKFIGMLHSHPKKTNVFSKADLSAYNEGLSYNDQLIDVIMYDIEKFNFIRFKHFDFGLRGEEIDVKE